MSALAKIHIAKKELCLEDDDYRAILLRITGQESAKGLSYAQADKLIEEFKRLGWKPQVIAGGKKSAPARKAAPADHPAAMKARALWLSLYHLGEVRNSSEAALEAFATRQLKCDRLIWADQQQMYKLIEALKKMAERAGWSQDLAGIPPRMQVMMLKRRLVRAQCAKLDLGVPLIVQTASAEQLHEMIKTYSDLIHKRDA